MIKTLSPYYINIPLVNPSTGTIADSYTVKIYIWSGNKTAAPSEPEYVITKINAAGSSGTDKINIGRIVNDFIDFKCSPQSDTVLVDGDNQVWVKFECFYDKTPYFPQLVTVELAVKGYGYFLEGENPQTPANGILLTGDEFKVNRGGRFVLPIFVGEPIPPSPEFIITEVVGNQIFFSDNFEHDFVYVFYKQTGDSIWLPISSSVEIGIASPILFEVPITGSVDLRLKSFDALTNQEVFSAPYTIEI